MIKLMRRRKIHPLAALLADHRELTASLEARLADEELNMVYRAKAREAERLASRVG